MVVYRNLGCGVHEGHHAEVVCFIGGFLSLDACCTWYCEMATCRDALLAV